MNRSHPDSRRCLRSLVFLAVVAGGPAVVAPLAGAPAPAKSVSGGTATFDGDQSQGIASGTDFQPGQVDTVVVDGTTTAIAPAAGRPGIQFSETGAGSLVINSGLASPAPSPVTIRTSGAAGIAASSTGNPPGGAGVPDPFFGVALPTDPGSSGGAVQVNSGGVIETGGASAPGISATSSTGGFPQALVSALSNYTGAGITFAVTGLVDPADAENPVAPGTVVDGTLIDEDQKVIAGPGGTFSISAAGAITFLRGTAFDELAEGRSAVTTVRYTVRGTNSGGATKDSEAILVVTVTRAEGGLIETHSVDFKEFGPGGKDDSALPDLAAWGREQAALASSGGLGNSVTVTNAGSITTDGQNSAGVLARSQGPGGAAGRSGSIFRSAGGGTAGGKGGTAAVTANGTITTNQPESVGVIAWSRGGTGGNGGYGGAWRYGGMGGSGGTGGLARVLGSGTITTNGAYSSGILAASTGGDGGGAGGSWKTVTGGGDGGAGGGGGNVDVEGRWNITTVGESAYGIWAKSAGGTAGAGGAGGWLAGHSGAGGYSADGGTVTVVSGGTISTTGLDAYGIFAESVGGFGGQGGTDKSLFKSRGGDGGSAGSGGAVSVTQESTGSITTNLAGSHGIFAQSVGGGGGVGAYGAAIAGFGGAGGKGGAGGAVNVTNAGSITTLGADSIGLYAQSVGGGGGDGGRGAGIGGIGGAGSATSPGGVVVVDNSGAIDSKASGIFAQSVGGSGGNGGSSRGLVSIGGTGGGGGDGEAVTVANSGAITTHDDGAPAIFAQSVGGGGGYGGSSVAAGAYFSLAIGGTGGDGGVGKHVDVTSTRGAITTTGDMAYGIVAQSAGGGGGTGGSAVSAQAGVVFSVSIGIGGEGGSGGDGGTVHLSNGLAKTASQPAVLGSVIETSGDNAHGIYAESVGGGGGAGGFSVAVALGGPGISGAVSLGGKGGGGGHGKAVDLDTYGGSVTTDGDHAIGVLAQSVGGGGGAGGLSVAASAAGGPGGSAAISFGTGGKGATGGTGGSVTIDTKADKVATSGIQSVGIVAQSVGGGGGAGGTSVSMAGAGAGALAGAVSVGVGGQGGAGNNGGTVVAQIGSDVTTDGDGSTGVLIQSVGGGGGKGGLAVTGAAAGAGIGSGAVTVGLGGDGDGGGSGNTVDATYDGTIITKQANSRGIIVQSVGGGGGDGGGTVAVALAGAAKGAGSITAGLGGAGGVAGDGGIDGPGDPAPAVKATVNGSVSTDGLNSTGVLVQSAGGGGGAGGYSVTVSGAGAGAGAGAIGIGLGGSGSQGGAGKDVLATVNATVTTLQNSSTGVLVQSVGGGGGDGGFNVTFAASGAGSGAGSIGFGLGGKGGGGGAAGAVEAHTHGIIKTSGADSPGFVAQSVGGGGGNGAFNFTGAFTGAGTGAGGISLGIGGSGGKASNGGAVTATTGADVETGGTNSPGILAQSVGGGGGSGGGNVNVTGVGAGTGSGALAIGVGGRGGGGGNGAAVNLTVENNVKTTGANSAGVFAQSVGGGGGAGGYNVTVSGSFASTGSAAASLGFGGAGAGGGDAGTATATVTGRIDTEKNDSPGFVTQSVGGGGGAGGINITAAVSMAGSASGAVAFGFGGAGENGGDGLAAWSQLTGGVETKGDRSNAVFTQSLGGGGGQGGLSVTGSVSVSKTNGGALGLGVGGSGGGGGDAAAVTSTVTTTRKNPLIRTSGDDATAIVAQSVGGGGGAGGLNVTQSVNVTGGSGASIGIGIGGLGGGGGDAGAVDLNVTGDILVTGNGSGGLLAQSVGGGGGSGGTNVAGSLNLNRAGSGNGIAASVGVGGFGGDGGIARKVKVAFAGDIAIADPAAEAIVAPAAPTGSRGGLFAQSVGGGGGSGGLNVSHSISVAVTSSDSHALAIGVGGFGGDGGNAGEVEVMVNGGGRISAIGDSRPAVVAQSVGGGGGSGGVNVSGGITTDAAVVVGFGGFGGDGGVGQTVTAAVTADLVSAGRDAFGILAQSIGGGGGSGGVNVSGDLTFGNEATASLTVGVGGTGGVGSAGGAVSVIQAGAVQTSGASAHGILAQSIGGGGGNGGFNSSGTVSAAKGSEKTDKMDVSLLVGVGGFGGKGADAGTVGVKSTGAITTHDEGARGILAQSIGGGGGNGGANFSAMVANKNSPVSIGVGGFGSGGGHAAAVTVERGTAKAAAGLIHTEGDGAIGIEASSIGGGGGDAGANVQLALTAAGGNSGTGGSGAGGDAAGGRSAGYFSTVLNKAKDWIKSFGKVKDGKDNSGFAVQVAIGGAGGDPGHGGTATVTHLGAIETVGDGSHGILGQSIGGGGGNAKINVAADYLASNAESKGFSLALGGAPGEGGNGGGVTVTHLGSITTIGDDALGAVAQSIGGGGGNAAMNFGTTLGGGYSLDVAIGRRGGSGGNGGAVTLTSGGSVTTTGARSYALFAQSVGGGGGKSGAISVSAGKPATKSSQERNASFSMGLEGGEGGDSDAVTIDASGIVSTMGEAAHAIFAQSVGGGGGVGGTATGTLLLNSGISFSKGGTGGTGGDSSTVTVTNAATVTTARAGSMGVFAQSVGGGGGTGGAVYSGGVETKKGGGILVAYGGTGGTSAKSGAVDVTNRGSIATQGSRSHGVLAQSVGGGGGDGGLVINAMLNTFEKDKTTLTVSLGGAGGSGADAGGVTVRNYGTISTVGADAVGIFAQSVGGGGGDGSTVVSGAVSTNGGANLFNVAIGGTGGRGGPGGAVVVVNAADPEKKTARSIDEETGDKNEDAVDPHYIHTTGARAHGIFAMSVGGGGGTGSTVVNATAAATMKTPAAATSVNFGLGGKGGKGGTGGTVTVTNVKSIVTKGASAHGIVALSVGGGGGDGGMSLSGNLQLKTDPVKSTIFSLAIGGAGGDADKAGSVTVTNNGTIAVAGRGAYGIYAQSVGGGGGNGGFAGALSAAPGNGSYVAGVKDALSVAVGGKPGGKGADGGSVHVTNTGTITSEGADSYGIYAQSVGGGGGRVGFSLSNPYWMLIDGIIDLKVGATGSDGAASADVSAISTGRIEMHGDNSIDKINQSVNGGGGIADMFLDLSSRALDLAEDGAVVIVDPATVGRDRAQTAARIAIGGSEVARSGGGSVTNRTLGELYSTGYRAPADVTESIGGGGGRGRLALKVGDPDQVDFEAVVGGTAVNGSSGGSVTHERTGNLVTLGGVSPGATVQSIGGGGGVLDIGVERVPVPAPTTTPSASGEAEHRSTAAAVAPGTAGGTVAVGASGGAGNNGGAIGARYSGDLFTEGTLSPGLLLQSIGGGGGQVLATGTDTLAVSLGGTGGASGDGGAIALVNSGRIQTTGTLSPAVALQSIGGGGGLVLTDLAASSVALTLRADNAGSGGAVSFEQTGDVVATGERSIAILAQSLGGGGGAVDRLFADTAGGAGRSGTVSLTIDGDVAAAGAKGVGILAQSRARDGQGNITVMLAPGRQLLAGVGGTALWLSGGADNRAVLRGLVATDDGLAGRTIVGTDGNDVIENSGTVIGQFDLGGGANRFLNQTGARLFAGPDLNLGGTSGLLQNAGMFVPGGEGHVQRTALAGGFQQMAGGVSLFELDCATGASDQVVATGAVDVAGRLELTLLHPEKIRAGSFSQPLFEGALGAANSGVTLVTAPSEVVQYRLATGSGRALALEYAVDFAPAGLGPNLAEVGHYVNRVQNAGSSPALADTVVQLLYDPPAAAYAAELAQLSPEFYGEHQADLVRGAGQFAALLAGRPPAGQATEVGRGRTVWFQQERASITRAAFDDYSRVSRNGNRSTAGLRQETGPWTAGVALELASDRIKGRGGVWTASADTEQAGLSLERRFERTSVSAGLSYGWNKTKAWRTLAVTTPATATAERDLEAAGGLVRVAHQFGRSRTEEGFSVTPSLDLGAVRLRSRAVSETGAGAQGLVLPSAAQTHAWITPRVEFSLAQRPVRGPACREFVRFAYQHYLNDRTTTVRAGLAGAPAGIDDMSLPYELGQGTWQAEGGIELGLEQGWSLQLSFRHLQAGHLRGNLGALNAAFAF